MKIPNLYNRYSFYVDLRTSNIPRDTPNRKTIEHLPTTIDEIRIENNMTIKTANITRTKNLPIAHEMEVTKVNNENLSRKNSTNGKIIPPRTNRKEMVDKTIQNNPSLGEFNLQFTTHHLSEVLEKQHKLLQEDTHQAAQRLQAPFQFFDYKTHLLNINLFNETTPLQSRWNQQMRRIRSNQCLQKNTKKSTQIWTTPPGIFKSLQQPTISAFYKFQPGLEYFPRDFTGDGDPRNFLFRKNIVTGSVINPPYKPTLLTPILHHLISMINRQKNFVAVILPLKPEQTWFRTFIEDEPFCSIMLNTPLTFLQGTEQKVIGPAPFRSFIWLPGIRCYDFQINNDTAGNFVWKIQHTLQFQTVEPIPLKTMETKTIAKFINTMSKLSLDLTAKRKAHYRTFQLQTPYSTIPEREYLQPQPQNRLPKDYIGTHHTPHEWTIRLPTKKIKKHAVIIMDKAKTAFTQFRESQIKILHPCTLCGSQAHSDTECFHAFPECSDLLYENDRSMYNFYNDLQYRNGALNLENGTPICRYQQTNESKTQYFARKLKNVDIRYREINTALENANIQFTLPVTQTFTLVRHSLGFWYAWGLPKATILRNLVGFRIAPIVQLNANFEIRHAKAPNKKNQTLHTESIFKRVHSGKLIPIQKNQAEMIIPEFFVKQPDKNRPILDASALNQLYCNDPIVYPTVETALNKFQFQGVAGKDLKSGYNQCPVAFQDLRFFVIRNGERFFMPTGLPQGHNRSPEIFHFWLQAPCQILKQNGFETVKLLDDILYSLGTQTATEMELRSAYTFVQRFFDDLGIITNDKDQNNHNIEALYLGQFVNTATNAAYPTDKKIVKVQDLLHEMIKEPRTQVLQLAGLMGLLNFMDNKAPQLFRQTYQNIATQVAQMLPPMPTKEDYKKIFQTSIPWTNQTLSETLRWLQRLPELTLIQKITKIPEILITTDASLNTGGAIIQTCTETLHISYNLYREATVMFNTTITPSTFRELIAIRKALNFIQRNIPNPKNHRLTFLTDNQALVPAFQAWKIKDPIAQTTLTQIRLEGWKLQVFWHRRSTTKGKIADALSKIQTYECTRALASLIMKEYNVKIKFTLDNQGLLRHLHKHCIVNTYLLKLLSKPSTLIIISPEILNRNTMNIIEFLTNYKFNGILVTPFLPTLQECHKLFKKKLKKYYLGRHKAKLFLPQYAPLLQSKKITMMITNFRPSPRDKQIVKTRQYQRRSNRRNFLKTKINRRKWRSRL